MTEPSILPLDIRKRLGWSQARMAEELGCHQSTVSRVELNPAAMNGMLRRGYQHVIDRHGLDGPSQERVAS